MTINYTIPENHPDLALLCEATKTHTSDLRSTSTSDANGFSYKGNYIKVHYLSYWARPDIDDLRSTIDQVNATTHEYRFELGWVDDYDEEYDHDRSWPAAFSIKSHKKTL